MKPCRWLRPILTLAVLAVFLAAPLVASAGQPIKLTLWSGYPEMRPYFDAAAKFYNELHPNVTIEVSTFPLRDIERKYAVSLPTNSGPDIAESHIYIAQMHIENGSLAPNPPEVTKFLKSGVFHPLFVSDSTWQGTVYGVPVLFSLDSLLYNTQMLKVFEPRTAISIDERNTGNHKRQRGQDNTDKPMTPCCNSHLQLASKKSFPLSSMTIKAGKSSA